MIALRAPRAAARFAPVSLLLMALAIADAALAQDFPARPVRIVTGEAGGGLDFTARLVGPGLTRALGVQVIVENRSGIVPGETVARAARDGHTVLLAGSTFILAPLFQKTPFDPVRDFAPISLTSVSPNLLVVHPAVSASSVRELVALAKAKPGALNYGSAATGSGSHLSGELFKSLTGVDIVRVNYKGNGPALVALMGGEIQMLIPPAGAAMPHVKAGRLRALAVTSREPSALFPGLPTVAASGLPGYESAAITSISAPAGTSAAIVERLNRDIRQAIADPALRERFAVSGAEAVASSPAELGALVRSEIAKWTRVVKDAKIPTR